MPGFIAVLSAIIGLPEAAANGSDLTISILTALFFMESDVGSGGKLFKRRSIPAVNCCIFDES